MAQVVKSNGSPTLYTLRRMFGVRAKRPSARNACIAAQLKGKSYSKPPAGMGGRYNKAVHAAFSAAAKSC